MVRELRDGDKTLYQCKECGFCYRDREFAEQCEAWCRKHKSCNLDITKHAIKKQATV